MEATPKETSGTEQKYQVKGEKKQQDRPERRRGKGGPRDAKKESSDKP